MSRIKAKEELEIHKRKAIEKISDYMDNMINSDNVKMKCKVDKLSFWLEDWTTFLNYETEFSPKRLKRYRRGEIIKVHLGFNVGSEEGGLHYAVVLDKNNSINSPVITVVPLTSLKKNRDIEHLHIGEIYLGNELFKSLNSKIIRENKLLTEEISKLKSAITNIESCECNIDTLNSRISKAQESLELIHKMGKEINRMKIGSLALTNQMCTISKIRIYDPKTNMDVLSNIKLSNEKLDLIDKSITELYTNVRK